MSRAHSEARNIARALNNWGQTTVLLRDRREHLNRAGRHGWRKHSSRHCVTPHPFLNVGGEAGLCLSLNP